MYFKNPDEATDLRDKAKKEEANLERRTQEALDSAKSRAGGILSKGEDKYNQAKVSSNHILYPVVRFYSCSLILALFLGRRKGKA